MFISEHFSPLNASKTDPNSTVKVSKKRLAEEMSNEPRAAKVAREASVGDELEAVPMVEPHLGPSGGEVLEGIAKIGSRDLPRPRMSTPVKPETTPQENLATW